MRKTIEKLLNSNLSSNHIATKTGISQSTISRIRSGERTIDNLTLKNAEKLYEYQKEIENMKNVKLIGNMSQNKDGYMVYINEVSEDTDTGYLFPNVPKEIVENDKVDELFNFDHHEPHVQKAKKSYDKNGLGYQIVKLEEGFTKFIEVNKEKMKEHLDYVE